MQYSTHRAKTMGKVVWHIISIIVSKPDILGPNGNLSDIKNLVTFEREMFGDSSYSYRIKSSYYLCQYYHFEIHA